MGSPIIIGQKPLRAPGNAGEIERRSLSGAKVLHRHKRPRSGESELLPLLGLWKYSDWGY